MVRRDSDRRGSVAYPLNAASPIVGYPRDVDALAGCDVARRLRVPLNLSLLIGVCVL